MCRDSIAGDRHMIRTRAQRASLIPHTQSRIKREGRRFRFCSQLEFDRGLLPYWAAPHKTIGLFSFASERSVSSAGVR